MSEQSKRRRELRDDVERTNKVHCRRDETLRLDQVIFGVHRRTAILRWFHLFQLDVFGFYRHRVFWYLFYGSLEGGKERREATYDIYGQCNIFEKLNLTKRRWGEYKVI